MKEKSIRGKVVGSYFAIVALIAIILALLWHERSVTMRIESEADSIRVVHNEICTVHHRITELAMRGETAMAWTDGDKQKYDSLLQETDSMLKEIKGSCKGYVQPKMIDSISTLLYIKEQHLVDLMEMMEQHKNKNRQLLSQLPKVAKRATEIKVEKRKKSGLAGLLGGKKNVTIVPSDNDRRELTELNDKIASRHEQRQKDIETFIDSLRRSNSELNTKINSLIVELDSQTQKAISDKESRISQARTRTLRTLAGISVAALIAIALLTINIRRELKRRRKYKEERERLIAELKHSNDEKDELIKTRRQIIQTVTHELRTPLTTIMGNAELSANSGGDEDVAMVHMRAESIVENTKLMDGMIDRMLSYFRLDSGKDTLLVKSFDISTVADMLAVTFEVQAEDKGLELNIENNAVGIVEGDLHKIILIGNNLISNAIKFTDKGSVSLKTSYSNGIFTMTVSDTGIGMNKNAAEKIFKPFERLSNAVERDGFGLGLTIVNQLVTLMYGNVKVESEKGSGSTFIVNIPLPIATEPEGEKETTSKRQIAEKLQGIRRIIAIDDSQTHLVLIKDQLAYYGVWCDACSDAFALMNMLRANDYDLLMTDIKMGGMNGKDILQILRKSNVEKLKTLPIVAMTAFGSISEEELRNEGFAACLYKPFSLNDIVEVISKCKKDGGNTDVRLDFTLLLEYGDRIRSLDGLITETKNCLDTIESAWAGKDKIIMRETLHKLGSLWSLVRAEVPLNMLGDLLKSETSEDSDIQAMLERVKECGRNIVETAEKMKEGVEA